ncbi:RodZ domain-containing protein [Amphritea sp. HPY]|uniref:RodZ domain-containing protein n=1 Tax=Amphritea sp. HPY TaxID=3421652 RepID=UPI003D7EC77A
MSNPEQQNNGEEQDSGFPVAELIAARENEHLSCQDVAKELRLSEKYIQAIEQGDFASLPSLVFARGYLRSYCKMVKLDVDRYLTLFDEFYGAGGNRGSVRSVTSVGQQAKLGDPIIRGSAWLFLLAVIAVSVWWWKAQQNDSLVVEAMPVTAPVEVESTDGSTVIVDPVIIDPVAPVSADQDQTSDIQGEVENVAGTLFVASDTQEAALIDQLPVEELADEQPVADNAETLPAVQASTLIAEATVAEVSGLVDAAATVGRLHITFTEECWVSVEDYKGEVLAMRVKPAGSVLNVSGKTPLKVHLGNAAAISSVSFNGEAVSFAKSTRSNVVRMTLPLSE